MKRRLAPALLLVLHLFPLSAAAQQSGLLAVMPLDASASGLDPAAKDVIEETVRTVAGDVLRPWGYTVLTGDNTLRILADNGIDPEKACEANCALDAARELNASLFVAGKVSQVEGEYFLFLRLYEQTRGQQIASRQIVAETTRALLTNVRDEAPLLFAAAVPAAPRQGDATPGGRTNPGRTSPGRASSDLPPLPSAPAFVEEGVVEFRSEPPGAVVRLNGSLLCQQTPCRRDVPKGAHLVVMERERYFPASQTTTLTGGKTVTLQLKPMFGTLDVQTDPPGIQVAVNGRAAGATPLLGLELDPAAYDVEVADRCFEPAREAVLVRHGESARVKLNPRPRLAAVTARAMDAGGDALSARVTVDERDVGDTPGTFQVPLCAQSITARLPDGRTRTERLFLDERRTVEVHLAFDEARAVASNVQQRPYPQVLHESDNRRVQPWAWWTGGIGAATWALAGIGALAVKSHVQDLPPGSPGVASSISAGQTLMIVSNVGAAALGVAVAGTYIRARGH